ncbi:thioesterase-like protein, putative [Bodo saltans]|uniref:Thioesterase-like protein, putative n=1 Tax=Bodo saltans TaxID=75058 RepID=A0A0S4IPE8_BODSA|nr:thioesterase-like protein, putative [Bodo saltans]|eukprot:CUE99469.1 thioesterase-like protein, putative [Bodo saltans]
MVLLHVVRSLRYLARGRFLSGPKIGVFDEVTTHVYAGFRMMDAFMHVNNARYLELFEFARWHEAGVKRSVPLFKAAGMYPVVGAVHIQFIKEVPPASLVMIRTKVVGLEDRALVARQHMFNRTGTKLHATAIFRVSLIDTRSKKPATISPSEALARLGLDEAEVRSAAEAAWLQDFVATADDTQSTTPEASQKQSAEKEEAIRVLRDVSVLDNDWRRIMKRLQDKLKPTKKSNK